MRKLLIALLAFSTIAFVGCAPAEPEGKIEDAQPSTTGEAGGTETTEQPKTTSNAPTGGDSGIAIHGAGAGGMAPVTGTENLQGSGGGGGGVGQAAKSAAQKAATSGSSVDQMSTEGE